MKNTTGVAKRCVSLALAAVMALSLASCKGKANEGIQAEGGSAPAQTGAAGEKIVNIGVTSSLNTLNPLLMDGVEMNKYATGLMFLPLMDLDKDMNFEGMLADSITAEDGSNFLVHIDDQAVWSDGTPVTADDVIYTALRICSPVIGNVAMMYYVFEGVGDDGFVEAGADHVEGITKVDDKTVRFTTKAPMSLITFKASYARYLMPLPKHVIENISEENLMSDPWFNKPDVVSGPYRVTEFDRDHYVAYEANKDYWKGAPKIDRLNIKIVEGSQLYAGLKSGEIDVTQNTMSSIPLEDYESVQSLENVNVSFGDPITNQSVFIRTSNIPDAKVRQAMLYAIDRRQILDQLLKGNGEVSEGFLSSASPYFDESITPVTYDPEKAKTLLEESGWDKNKTIKFCIDSGDSTFVNAASVIAAQWAAVGIKADIQTMDINTLLGNANKGDFDVMAVQYTYPPVDPYADVAWLLGGEGSWTEYSNDKVNEALSKVQLSSDIGELKGLYSIIDKQVQEDVPMFSAYIIKTMAAVNKRLTGAEPSVYGFLNHVEQWDIAQ
ncbi:ABC transporter substrate-binding protein [Enterocloster citroniae]|uniref:ABC transporter substrate-binding protein n=1 Tax=Enterocloster citroniae TaxID=358743 RepID=UPI001D0957C1|nr:ABC transporter substrate-binding protein [Enterocloster citroniae]MCB7066285.1 ABC transporter substrate-binding protein [Enterocloster citroniae]